MRLTLTLVVRSSLEERKTRRFLRADLAAEARESLRVLDIFLNPATRTTSRT